MEEKIPSLKLLEEGLHWATQQSKNVWATHSKDPSHLCVPCLHTRLMMAIEEDDLAMFEDLCHRTSSGFTDVLEQQQLRMVCGHVLTFCTFRGGPQVLPIVRVLFTKCYTLVTEAETFNATELGPDYPAIEYAIIRQEKDLVLEMLRWCPEESKFQQAEIAFASACGFAHTGIMSALLRGEEANEEQGIPGIPRIDPWTTLTEEGHPAFTDVVRMEDDNILERIEAVRMLVQEMGCDVLVHPSPVDQTHLLHHIVAHDLVDILRMLVNEHSAHQFFGGFQDGKKKEDVKGEEDIEGNPCPVLHSAALAGNLNMLRYLVEEVKMPIALEDDIIIHTEGESSRPIRGTVLHVAAGAFCPEETLLTLIKWLVEHGLDPESKNSEGQTTADVAQQYGNHQIYDFLTRQKRAEEAEAARLALLAELDAEDEMQAKKKEKNKKKKEKKKQQKNKQGNAGGEEDDGGVEAAATALGGLRLFDDEVQDVDVPTAFLCGLTHKLMHHPVVAQDGVSYEATALKKYIAQTKASGKPLVSPATGEKMGEMSLPNHLMRTQIEEWVEDEKKKNEQEGAK